MSSQVCSVPGQTEQRRKAFLEWKNIDLSFELSLLSGDNINYYKSVNHHIPTRIVRIGNIIAIFKIN